MLNRYANNLNQRVIVQDHQSLLGCDVGANGATDVSVLPLFFKKEQGMIQKNGASISQYIYDELNTVKGALTNLLEGKKHNLVSLVEAGELYVASNKKQLLSDFKSYITLGSEFAFMDRVVPSSRMYLSNMQLTREKVHSYFKVFTGSVNQLVLWSYPQIMYGEFNAELHEDARKNSDEAFKHQQMCIEVYESAAVQLGIEPDKLITKRKRCDSMQDIQKQISKQSTKVARLGLPLKATKALKAVKAVNRVRVKRWSFDIIEVGDVVAFRTQDIDANYINIPGMSNGFNLLHIVSADSKSRKVEGHCYRGGVYGLILSKSVINMNIIEDTTILWVWTLEHDEKPEDFMMTEENIHDLKSMFV